MMRDVGHWIYDHGQVLLSLAKWADTKAAEKGNRFYEHVSHLELPISNAPMMDIILTITYLLACKKDHPTMEEIQSLVGKS